MVERLQLQVSPTFDNRTTKIIIETGKPNKALNDDTTYVWLEIDIEEKPHDTEAWSLAVRLNKDEAIRIGEALIANAKTL